MGVEAGDVEGLGTPIHDGRAGQRRDDELLRARAQAQPEHGGKGDGVAWARLTWRWRGKERAWMDRGETGVVFGHALKGLGASDDRQINRGVDVDMMDACRTGG